MVVRANGFKDMECIIMRGMVHGAGGELVILQVAEEGGWELPVRRFRS